MKLHLISNVLGVGGGARAPAKGSPSSTSVLELQGGREFHPSSPGRLMGPESCGTLRHREVAHQIWQETKLNTFLIF